MDQDIVTSQITAALRMLHSTIEACPDPLLDHPSDHNRFWALAYLRYSPPTSTCRRRSGPSSRS